METKYSPIKINPEKSENNNDYQINPQKCFFNNLTTIKKHLNQNTATNLKLLFLKSERD